MSDPPPDASLALLLRRAALAETQGVPGPDAQIGWAEACLAHGEADAARLLYESAFIRQGFSAHHRVEQARIARATGLWPDEIAVADDASAVGTTAETAVAELRALARAVAEPIGEAIARGRSAEAPQAPSADVDLAALTGAIFRLLRAPGLPDRQTADATVAALRAAVDRSGRLDLKAFAGASLPLLATALAYAGLVDFFGAHGDLIAGPFGSVALLHEAARLGSAGLGPYFRNVQRIARRSRDVFELAAIARDASLEAGFPIDRDVWLILLSRALSGPLLDEFIDDLGDMGAMSTLTAIFERVSRVPGQRADMGLILRLRDTAIDNLDYGLAARAQAFVALSQPDNMLERMILGIIEASGGRIAAAEQAFAACLVLDPANPDVTERLVALRARAFRPYRIDRGYGSPDARWLARMRRRGSDAGPAQPRPTRPVAVEL